jgi:hypothetical protein
MKRRDKRVSSRWRLASVLAIGVAVGSVMVATPAGAHVGGTVNHLWGHLMPKADARYLQQRMKTVVVSDTALNGQHEVAIATCPTGYRATGGGVDPNNVLTMAVTSSGPTIAGQRTLLTADGTHGSANGWWGAVVNNSGSSAVFKVTAICAK